MVPSNDRQETDSGFELASALLTAWLLADLGLRQDLDRAIRAYVRRNPGFQADLRRALEYNEQLRTATLENEIIKPIGLD